MNKMQKAMTELAEMDELAAQSSPVHSLHPAAKLIATVAYILVTLSFDKYDLGGLVPMVLFDILKFFPAFRKFFVKGVDLLKSKFALD